MSDENMVDLFKKRENFYNLVLEGLASLERGENKEFALAALTRYIESYADATNYLLELLMQEIEMANAYVEELKRD